MKKLNEFEQCYIPKPNTQAYQLLLLLLERDQVPEAELTRLFNGRQRSPLQTLGGDRFYWKVINHRNNKGVIFARSLDPRHKTGSKLDDAKARAERKKAYKEDSHKQATQGRLREPKAFNQSITAKQELFELVGKAANDALYKKEAE